jgi:hypothetical protein
MSQRPAADAQRPPCLVAGIDRVHFDIVAALAPDRLDQRNFLLGKQRLAIDLVAAEGLGPVLAG